MVLSGTVVQSCVYYFIVFFKKQYCNHDLYSYTHTSACSQVSLVP